MHLPSPMDLLEAERPQSGLSWRLGLSLPGVCSRMVTDCAEWPGVLVVSSDSRQNDSSSVAFQIVLGGGCQQEANVESGPSLPRAPTHGEGSRCYMDGRGEGALGAADGKALMAESQPSQMSLAKGLASRLQTEVRGLGTQTSEQGPGPCLRLPETMRRTTHQARVRMAASQ